MTYCPLDLVENYLRRYVAYPSEHALVAHALWIAHTHMIDDCDCSPRLAFMSAEKESGKTRALEATEPLVPNPIMSISASPAAIVRRIAEGGCTLLYDEIDAVFGTVKAQEANADLRSVLNGGYRRGAKVHRCVTGSKRITSEEMDAFAPVALAGLRELPDTLGSRAIIIRMRRRAPGEQVAPFRQRYVRDEAQPIFDALEEWCVMHAAALADPVMPEDLGDRQTDIWEPLIAIADLAGGDWPARARAAAIALSAATKEETLTPGVELLAHICEAFGEDRHLATTILLERLHNRDESPWRDIRGRPLDDRGLARRLRPYGIHSRNLRIGGRVVKGYDADDFSDAWSRYLPASPERYKRYKRYNIDNNINSVADVAAVAATTGREAGSEAKTSVADDDPIGTPHCVADDASAPKVCPRCAADGWTECCHASRDAPEPNSHIAAPVEDPKRALRDDPWADLDIPDYLRAARRRGMV